MGGRSLGYNIKYITREGNKTPTLFYEVTPGEWVPRSQIPENIEYRKKTYNERRAKDFEYLVIVIFDKDYQLLKILEFSWDEFLKIRKLKKPENKYNVPLTKKTLDSGIVIYEI